MADTPLLSVVIITRNRRPALAAAVASLKAQDFTDYELIIVDNASADDTADYVKTELPEAIFLPQEENFGVAGARNIGVARASGEILFFLDDDGRIRDTDVVGRACRMLEEEADLAVVFGRTEDPEGGKRIKSYFWFQTDCKPWPNPVHTARYLGGFCFIRMQTFRELGRYDDSFFLEAEDLDFSLAVHGAGKKIRFVPAFVLLHPAEPERGPRARLRYYDLRNTSLAYWKHLPLGHAFLFCTQIKLTRLWPAIRGGWIHWWFAAALKTALRLPGILLKGRRPIGRKGLQRFMLLNTYPFEDYAALETHAPISVWTFMRLHRAHSKARARASEG